MLKYDSHIHVGQYKDFYFEPRTVGNSLHKMGISKWVVSSTSTFKDPHSHKDITEELLVLKNLYPAETIILLWVSPTAIENIHPYMEEGIYSGFKIHPRGHDWSDDALHSFFTAIERYKVPVLIHTGGDVHCDCGRFLPVAQKYPTIKMTFAHGRPVEEALEVLQACSNATVDTAFMAIKDIEFLIAKGFENRILIGSDYPLDQVYYTDEDIDLRYKNRLNELQIRFGATFFENSNKLFDSLYSS